MEDNYVNNLVANLAKLKRKHSPSNYYDLKRNEKCTIKKTSEKNIRYICNNLNKKHKNKYFIKAKVPFRFNIFLLLAFIILFSPIAYTKKNAPDLKALNYDSIITLTLKGGANQKILYSSFQPHPYKIEINGSILEPPNIIVSLPEGNDEYIITMMFDKPVNSTYNMFSNLNSNIIKIDLSNFDFSQVTEMKFMFNSCKNLEYINFTNINTSLVSDMRDLFQDCFKLTSLDLSFFDTSLVTDMTFMFYGCNSLSSLDLSNFITKKVENMNHIFSGCMNLTSVDLSSFDTSSVTWMSGMFKNCFKLTSINISHFNTSAATTMANMFTNTSIISLDLSNFNTSNVENMENMFGGCSNLLSLNISNFDTSKVIDMDGMFQSCSNLLSLDLSNFDTSSATSMGFMFSECNKLVSLKIENFNTSKVTTMAYMFSQCYELPSLNLSSFNTSKVTTMANMFSQCYELTSLNLSSFNTSKVSTIRFMFNDCIKITSLNLSNFDCSQAGNMNNMFDGCKELKSLDISNFNPLLAQNMANMFSGCEKLTSLNLSNFGTNKATNMANMFYNCKELKTLDVSNFNTSLVTYMQFMFSGCESLVSLDVSNFDLTKISRIDNMFSNCSSLVYLNLDFNKNLSKLKNKTDIFNRISENLKFCTNITIGSIFLSELNSPVQCMDNCFNRDIKLIVEKKECIDNCRLDIEYPYEYNNLCYNNCPENTHKSSRDEYLCEDDVVCEKYYNLDKSECIDEILEGYYLKDYQQKIVDRCHEDCKTCDKKETEGNTNCNSCKNDKSLYFGNCVYSCTYGIETDELGNNVCKCASDNKCKECTKESSELNLCTICNDGFYTKLNDEANQDSYINCYKNLDGYYLDVENSIYKPCYDTCETCNKEGTKTENNCLKCRTDYSFNENEKENNCYKNCDYYYYFDESNEYKCTIDDKCPQNRNKLILEKNKCIDECKNDNIYINEYNNICYQNCPNGYKPKNNICVTETEEIETNKNLDTENEQTNEITNEETDENTETDKEITDEETVENTRTDKEITDEETDENTETDKEITDEETVENTETDKEITDEETVENTETDKEITDEETVENTETDKNTDRETEKQNSVLNCRAEDLFSKGSCGVNITNPANKDQLISNIQNDIINHKIDDLIDNITETKQDLVVREEDTIYQITTTENQNNNKYNNISSVKLGDCEDRLKDIYGISKNKSLIIFKIDYYSPGLKIPIIGYEIFHPVNKSKLDLNYCKDILVELNIPVSIDEDNIFKYDPNSGYYTDECVPTTSDSGTDIILNDRQNEFNDNNLSLCQNNCTFTGYDTDTKKALCDCEVKTKIILISEIIDDQNKLSNNFTEIEGSSSNIITMKCFSTLFTKEGLLTNIGSYILIFVVLLFGVSSILFYKVGYVMLENCINDIISEKSKLEERKGKNYSNIYKFDPKSSKNVKNKNKSRKKSNKFSKKAPPKKKSRNTNKNKTKNESFAQSELKLKDVKILLNFQKRKTDKKSSKKYEKVAPLNEKKIMMNKKFNDYELNSFSYEEALMYDKRKPCEYYISLLKTKHPLIFSFVPTNDYNTMIIKVCLFFLSFCVFYAVNALFITEDTIHQLYEDGGSYNFVYSLPQIVYSFIISHIFTTVIKYIFLSERNIIQIRREKSFNDAQNKVDKVKRILIIKYIIFFVVGILFLILFWYYLSSFGAVYQNSQVYLIKNTFISFLLSFLYPFVINIIPPIFRISSLNKEKNRQCLYNFSKFMSLI